jgi:hypothetical protein
MLERYAVKVARTVLRRGSGSNATSLSDHPTGRTPRVFGAGSELWQFPVSELYSLQPYPSGAYPAKCMRDKPQAVGRFFRNNKVN